MDNSSASADPARLSRRRFTAATAATATTAAALTVATPAAALPRQPACPPRSTADWATCLTVARALLVVDEHDRPLVPRYEKVLAGGLPAPGPGPGRRSS